MLKTDDGRVWISLKEAQKEFGVTYATLHRLCRSGSIDSMRVHERALLIDYNQLKFWHERFYRKSAAERMRQIWQERRDELIAKVRAGRAKKKKPKRS
ncbi:MAG: hypothetical protein RUDDFDWM_002036 [Candidatus Fervidibacterota bacterium]